MLDMATLKITDAPPPAGAMLDAQGRSTLGGPFKFTQDMASKIQAGMREKFGDGVSVSLNGEDAAPELPQDRLPNDVGGVSGKRLLSFIERVERLESETRDLGDDKKQVFAEAKGAGFNTKIMKKVIRLRRMDKEKRDEEESLLQLYADAVGLQMSLDL